MSSFPVLTGGRTFLAPLVEERVYPVTRLRFADGSQQRYRAAPATVRYTLTLSRIPKVDADTLRSFFDGRKGSFDSFDLTIHGATISGLRFDQDELRLTETAPGRYDCILRLAQRTN